MCYRFNSVSVGRLSKDQKETEGNATFAAQFAAMLLLNSIFRFSRTVVNLLNLPYDRILDMAGIQISTQLYTNLSGKMFYIVHMWPITDWQRCLGYTQ